MQLTVDSAELSPDSLGLVTVGDAISHASADNRLVVSLLIDGQEPDQDQLPSVRALPLSGRHVYIETADKASLAEEVLQTIGQQINQADALRKACCTTLSSGDTSSVLPQLSGCFSIWLSAQSAIRSVCDLLHIPLSDHPDAPHALTSMLSEFSSQLRQIKDALEQRDFVLLSDVLQYDMEFSAPRWHDAIQAVRSASPSLANANS